MIKKIFTLTTLTLSTSAVASAHVAYVVDKYEMSSNMGSDFGYFLSPLKDPFYVALIIATILVIGFANIAVRYNKTCWNYLERARRVLSTYHELIPWIMRLALGISLIGAGTTGVFVSPVVSDTTFSVLEILLGFLLMSGFLLVPATLITIGLYFVALSQTFYMLGNLDFLALAVAILVFHSARPGVDDILGISLLAKIRISRKYLALILRIGIGGAMIFLALYEKILNPHMSELVLKSYNLTSIVPVSESMWIFGAGTIELFIGLMILIGAFTRTTSAVAFAVLSLSFFYFKESVSSHVTLFATLSILLIEGGGYLSLDRFMRFGSPLAIHPREAQS